MAVKAEQSRRVGNVVVRVTAGLLTIAAPLRGELSGSVQINPTR